MPNDRNKDTCLLKNQRTCGAEYLNNGNATQQHEYNPYRHIPLKQFF